VTNVSKSENKRRNQRTGQAAASREKKKKKHDTLRPREGFQRKSMTACEPLPGKRGGQEVGAILWGKIADLRGKKEGSKTVRTDEKKGKRLRREGGAGPRRERTSRRNRGPDPPARVGPVTRLRGEDSQAEKKEARVKGGSKKKTQKQQKKKKKAQKKSSTAKEAELIQLSSLKPSRREEKRESGAGTLEAGRGR